MNRPHYLSSLFEPAGVLLIVDDQSPPSWAEPLLAASVAGPEQRLREHHSETAPVPIRLCAPASLLSGQADVQVLQDVELVVIAVPADEVIGVMQSLQAMRDAASRSTPNQLLLLTPALDTWHQLRWAMIAREGGWRLLGPSSAGFVRPHRGLNLGAMGMLPPAGEIALVSQSGALGAAMLDWAQEVGTGFSLVVALGDEADVDLAQVLDFVASDRRTRSIIVYLEAVHSARRFLSALRALSLSKPVIVLKGGRFAATAAGFGGSGGADEAGSAVYESVLRRAGAVQIQIFAQVEIIARYLAARSVPVGPRLGIVSNGRGPAVLAVDEAIGNRMRVPSVGGMQANPALLGAQASPAQIVDALQALGESDELDALLMVIAPYRSLDADDLVKTLAKQARHIGLPVFAALLGGERVREQAHALEQCGIPVFATPEAAVNAYAHVARFHENQKLLLQMPRPLSGLLDPELDQARLIVERVLSDSAATPMRRLMAADAKALLAAFHVPMVDPQPARGTEQAVSLADGRRDPVAPKVLSLDTAGPIELHIGVYRDPLWGPVMSFGAGGVSIGRLRRNSALELPPLNRFLARKMIERSRVYGWLSQRLAEGGRFDADLHAIEGVLLRASEIVCEMPQVIEIELNPLIADSTGVRVAEARILVAPAPPVGDRYAHMAIMPYPAYLEQRLVTRSGRVCKVRPIQPEDAEPLQAMVRRLSPQARYFRFVSTLFELPPRLLLRFTQIDYDREVALAAVVDASEPIEGAPAAAIRSDGDGEDERIVGVGRYLLNPDGESCEFAIVIDDAWQGQGLGGHLMNSLVSIAGARGLKRIEGYVLGTNYPMLSLMRHLGFKLGAEPDEPDMRRVWRDLAPPTAAQTLA